MGEGDCLVAEFGFGVDQDGFVDQILEEEGAVEVGAALEEEAEDVALAEGGQDGGKAEASGVVGDGFDLGAMVCQGCDFGAGGGGAAQDQQVVRRGTDELRGEWDAEVGVEDDAKERATAEELDRIETNIAETEAAARTGEATLRHIRQFYNLLGEISGNEVLAILIEATSSITLDFAASHGVEFTDELIVLRRKVLSRLRARDADGASRRS